jgi:predicted RNA methylase
VQQRTLDFDRNIKTETCRVAEATSLPPPSLLECTVPPLVRPDRQLTFGGIPHYEWPAPEHDRDTITVDRIREDIDGPSHRFVICRGDTVEVFFSHQKLDIGEVTGVSHRNNEVRVSFQKGSEGIWVGTGCVYPAPPPVVAPVRKGVPLSKVVAECCVEPLNGFTDADRVPAATVSYSFDEYKVFRRDFASGSVSFSDYHAQFDRLCQSQVAIVSELKSRFKATELAVIASRMGSFDAKRSTKDQNAESIYRRMLSSFVLDGTVSFSMGERYEDAVKKKVLSVTEEDFTAAFVERQVAADERHKALTDPQTFFEFRTFLQQKSEADLSDEQLSRYDALHADMTRERRAAQKPVTVDRFQSEELSGHEFVIKEGFHDKRQCPLWIVTLTSRVERATFDELNRKAKMLGGWFSSFKKSDAGFQFLSEDKAQRFASLLTGDVDRSDVLSDRKERKELTAAERLHELASALALRSGEALEASNSSLQNTARRADIQSGVRGRAFTEAAQARTMHSIAEALSRGEAKFLDGIRHRTQLETLDTILYLAKWARVRASRQRDSESSYGHSRRLDRLEEQPIGEADIRFAEYPYPYIYKRHLEEAVRHCRTTKGSKQACEKMAKRLAREEDDFVTFRQEHDIEALADFLSRAKGAGANVEWIERALEKHNRLQRANITDVHELRSALHEFMCHRAEARGDDPVKVAERELIGKDLPGFFPTPRPIIEMLLERASIGEQHRVLEPSCGKGDILDAIQAECSGCQLHAIEFNQALSDILSVKGHEVEFADFLDHRDNYDRIVMNPPFENGQDIEHVRHAYDLLSPDGRLVAVVSEGPFFRSDKKSVAFREWLDAVGAEVESLPDEAFKGAEAFRQTSVRTRVVTIAKEGAARSAEPKP